MSPSLRRSIEHHQVPDAKQKHPLKQPRVQTPVTHQEQNEEYGSIETEPVRYVKRVVPSGVLVLHDRGSRHVPVAVRLPESARAGDARPGREGGPACRSSKEVKAGCMMVGSDEGLRPLSSRSDRLLPPLSRLLRDPAELSAPAAEALINLSQDHGIAEELVSIGTVSTAMDVMYKVGDRKVVMLMVMLLANLTQLDSGARSLLQNILDQVYEKNQFLTSPSQNFSRFEQFYGVKNKLSIGGTAEKIVSALHTVLSKHPDEDTDLDKCKNAVRRLEKMEKDVEVACAREYREPTTVNNCSPPSSFVLVRSGEFMRIVNGRRSSRKLSLYQDVEDINTICKSLTNVG
ncbi:uncharacterized protein A4U43_C06F6910 [Asparagus officinalis]|uniref:Uncharacterized protein n=1 Tax=Asparagus officinalis TaxID=4686 RepID=A0A5P1ENH9_ASPOF|nr:uncharacterized protein A4U43_C06F6910 [Asparagus officinalis]